MLLRFSLFNIVPTVIELVLVVRQCGLDFRSPSLSSVELLVDIVQMGSDIGRHG